MHLHVSPCYSDNVQRKRLSSFFAPALSLVLSRLSATNHRRTRASETTSGFTRRRSKSSVEVDPGQQPPFHAPPTVGVVPYRELDRET